MKHRLLLLVAPVLGLLMVSSCKKDKTRTGGEPELPKIILVKAADDNTGWNLNVDAAATDRSAIWVDLNNNGRKETGESFSDFGMDVSNSNTFPLGSSKTIAVYGKLTKFGCTSNNLTSLDLSKNTELDELDCAFNSLTALNVSTSTKLVILDCSYNQLTALDVTKNTGLKGLYCYYNELTTLDLTQNKALTDLHFLKNRIATLNLSQNTALERLTGYNNLLTALDLSKNTAIKEIDITRNKVAGANMQQLLASLPTRTVANKGTIFLLYETPEGNTRPTTTDITNAKNKNWVVYEWKNGAWAPM